MNKSKLAIIRDFFYGIIMGVTTTIPGISFGTLAIFLNIYEKILNAASVKTFKENLHFLIPLILGAVVGIFSFSRLVTFLLEEHHIVTYFCFIGLIIGCIPMIYKRAVVDRLRVRNVIVFVLALAFMLYLAFMSGDVLTNKNLAEFGGISPSLILYLFSAGMFHAFIMIIPGISGSIVMLMLGAYTVIVESLSTLNGTIILVVGTGIIIGAAIGIKVIKILLKRHPQATYCAVLGLIIGSIFIIYPGFVIDLEGLLAIVGAIVFGLVSFFFSRRS